MISILESCTLDTNMHVHTHVHMFYTYVRTYASEYHSVLLSGIYVQYIYNITVL